MAHSPRRESKTSKPHIRIEGPYPRDNSDQQTNQELTKSPDNPLHLDGKKYA